MSICYLSACIISFLLFFIFPRHSSTPTRRWWRCSWCGTTSATCLPTARRLPASESSTCPATSTSTRSATRSSDTSCISGQSEEQVRSNLSLCPFQLDWHGPVQIFNLLGVRVLFCIYLPFLQRKYNICAVILTLNTGADNLCQLLPQSLQLLCLLLSWFRFVSHQCLG